MFFFLISSAQFDRQVNTNFNEIDRFASCVISSKSVWLTKGDRFKFMYIIKNKYYFKSKPIYVASIKTFRKNVVLSGELTNNGIYINNSAEYIVRGNKFIFTSPPLGGIAAHQLFISSLRKIRNSGARYFNALHKETRHGFYVCDSYVK